MKENQEENKEQKPTENNDGGVQQQPVKSVVDANAAAERLEKATEAQRKENDRSEELKARAIIGGSDDATKPVKKEETDEEYVERFKDGAVNPLKENAE